MIFQLLFYVSAAPYCLLRETNKHIVHPPPLATDMRLLQKRQLLHIKTCCTVSHEYICYINAVDNSSLFLGLLGHIKADSRESESLKELGGIVFIKG